jgi:biopolymer transport protein ExbD
LPIRPENALSVTPQGTITWNGTPTSEAELAATLASLVQLDPEPLVKFEPAPAAPYGTSVRVIRIVKYSGPASFAFVGTERFADFGKAAPGRGN